VSSESLGGTINQTFRKPTRRANGVWVLIKLQLLLLLYTENLGCNYEVPREKNQKNIFSICVAIFGFGTKALPQAKAIITANTNKKIKYKL
jgi:hypothetical protein